LIPYAGPVVAAGVISLVAFATGGVPHGIAAVIYFAIYGMLEGNVLGPMVFKKTVRTNPLLVTLAILFLAEVGGVFGAVVAVPVVAVLQIVVGLLLESRRAALLRWVTR
jgi:predicted PurR-regulated permease PerM